MWYNLKKNESVLTDGQAEELIKNLLKQTECLKLYIASGDVSHMLKAQEYESKAGELLTKGII